MSLLFSVVIPTFNRPRQLGACLSSLCDLAYAGGAWEVVVVNDGGRAPWPELPSALQETLPLRALDLPHRGPAAARNAGATEARGQYLAFTDDDCRPFPDWLSRFEEGFAAGPWDALAGRSLNPWPKCLATRSHEYLIDFLQNYSRFPSGDVYLACSNNVAYKREVFQSLGGYDGSFLWPGAEDRELGHRLLARGFRQGYLPEARVWHDHGLTAWEYIVLQFRYGRGDDVFRRALLRNCLPRWIGQRRRPQFHLALVGQMQEDRLPLAMSALLALSQVAHWVGSRYQRLSHGLDSTALTPRRPKEGAAR